MRREAIGHGAHWRVERVETQATLAAQVVRPSTSTINTDDPSHSHFFQFVLHGVVRHHRHNALLNEEPIGAYRRLHILL